MEFIVEYDGYDGLVLIDEQYLNDMSSELLYSIDILLDYYGKTELVYDFPEENWETVRRRETKKIKDFCNLGKMIICLSSNGDKEHVFQIVNELSGKLSWLNIPTGKLVVLTAGELIQCMSYPELEMEKIFEVEVEKGWYALSINKMGEILCCHKRQPREDFNNILEECIL